MTKVNPISKNIGAALHRARDLEYLPHYEVARMLNIPEELLCKYENGYTEIPKNILELLFSQGLAMIRARYIHNNYMEFAKKLREQGLLYEITKKYPMSDNK